MKKIVLIMAALAIVLTGCSTDADVASRNLSKAAEQFEIERHIVFINGFTDNYLLEVVGRCSYEVDDQQVVVICKTGESEDELWKHTLIRSDNVTAVIEQLGPAKIDVYRHRVIFKPESLIPRVDLETSLDE